MATVDRPEGAGGVLYASGTENSGLTVFVQDDHLVFDYNAFGDHTIVESTLPVPVGESAIGVEFRRTGQTGTARLVIDGADAGSVEIPYVMAIMSSIGPSVGQDHGSQVSERYDHPFAFEGTLARLDIVLLSPSQAQEADAARAEQRAAMARQ